MKRLVNFFLFIFVVLCFTGCDHILEAVDDSLHTAKFYFYNYTSQEFYAKLTPFSFRAKQKFRIQKSDYIPVKTDDEKITIPAFSFEWIPGDFYINVTQNKSEELDAYLQFFNHKNQLPIIDASLFEGVPSAQDFSVSFYLVECFCKKTLTFEEIKSCISKITDKSDLALFEEFYGYDEEIIKEEYDFSAGNLRRNGVYLETPVQIKNYLREMGAIVKKYDLPERESINYLFCESIAGTLDYKFTDPENEKYRPHDSDDSDDGTDGSDNGL